MNAKSICSLCGESMPPGEEMFKYHGSSGPCPKPPKTKELDTRPIAEQLTDALPDITGKSYYWGRLVKEATDTIKLRESEIDRLRVMAEELATVIWRALDFMEIPEDAIDSSEYMDRMGMTMEACRAALTKYREREK